MKVCTRPNSLPGLVTLGCRVAAVVLYLAASSAHSQTLSGSSLEWTPISFGTVLPDPIHDQQTGQQEGDIVGNFLNPAVFTAFDNGNTPSLTDGTLFYRVRLGGDENPGGFSRAFFVGIDATGDGALDAFIGVNNAGMADAIGIWNAGAGANNSPSTTTIAASAFLTYAETSGNYDWRPVSMGLDGGSVEDVDGGTSGSDYYLSYSVPFADVVSYFSTVKGIAVDENTIFRYVFATATQANSLNQDLGGIDGGVNSDDTWSYLGIMSEPMAVPEPGSAMLLLGGLAVLWRRRPRGR